MNKWFKQSGLLFLTILGLLVGGSVPSKVYAQTAQTWGKTTIGALNTGSAHSRSMGGTSPNTSNMQITSMSVYLGAQTGNVRIGLYTGGSESDPAAATLLWDAGTVNPNGVAGWYTIHRNDGGLDWDANTVTWQNWKRNTGVAVYYDNSTAGAGDFQTARGRNNNNFSQDPTVAYPGTYTDTGTFADFWYSIYVTYTTTALSGTVYTDEGTTNIGAGKTVSIVKNGVFDESVTTDSSGAWAWSGTFVDDDLITVYLDDESENAVTVTRTGVTAITDLDLYQGRLIVRHDDSGSLTNADLAIADNTGDQDITSVYTMSTNELTVAGTVELYVESIGTYAPGDIVVTGSLDVNGTMNAAANALTVSGSFDITGGVLTTTGTVNFTADHSINIIHNGTVFQNLNFNNATGQYVLTEDLDVNGNITVTAGTLDVSTSNYTVNLAGDFTNVGGDFEARNGLVVLDGTDQRLEGSIDFYNLTKVVTTARTLTFGAGDTYTIANNLILAGAAGQLLSLVSDTGADWNIQVNSQTVVNFVDVNDSEVVGSSGNDILAVSSTNGGGNDDGGVSPQWVFVDNRYWVGTAGGNTSVDSNWSSTEAACGGGTATTAPTVTENAVFSDMCDNNATVDSTFNVGGLQIESGHTGTITPNALIDVDGPFAMDGGTIDFGVNNTDIQISSNVIISAGTVTAGTGSLTLDGNLLYNDSNNTNFGHVYTGTLGHDITLISDMTASQLTVVSGNQLITGGYDLDVNGAITVNGTLNATDGGGGTTDINVSGNWDMTNGAFVSTNSTVVFDGAVNVTSNGKSFNNVRIASNTAGATVTTLDDMDIDGDLNFGTAATANWNISNDTVSIGGDADYANLDTFTTTSSTVRYNGTVLQTVASDSKTFNVIEGANVSAFGVDFTEAFTTTDLSATTLGAKMQFQQSTTFTISGNLNLQGGSNQEVEINSIDGSTQFTFSLSSEQDVDFVKVGNSNAAGFDINVSNGVNDGGTDAGTGTPEWVFVGAGSNVFTVSGTMTFVVPKGVTQITIKSWGAGGGGAGGGTSGIGGAGGGGGFAQGTISVTPFETLNVHVGGFGDEGEFSTGGAGASSGDGGGGGGRSGVFRVNTPLIVAGGGGGGGGGDNSTAVAGGSGGPGGGLVGTDGGTSTGVTGGGGGTQVGPGSGGTGGNNSGAAGVGIAGGDGADGETPEGSKGGRANGGVSFGGAGGTGDTEDNGYGGGGGGGAGYFGGGGGSGSLASNAGGGGGGGGSSYVDSAATGVVLTAGSGTSAGNNTDSDYAGSAGQGGSAGAVSGSGSDGNNGRVVINYVAAAVDLSGTSDLPDATTVGIAVNGSLCLETGTVTGGAFSIDDVPVLINEPVTIWADGVADASEATSIFKYDGSGAITGLVLNAATLTVGSNDNATLTLTDFNHYDQSDDEDILYTTTTGTVVTVDSANDQTINIRTGNTLSIGSLEGLVAHNIDIDGGLTTSGTIAIDGNWDATGGTVTPSGGTVTFNGSLDQNIITGNRPFPNIVFNNTGGAADDDLIVDGILDINGTLTVTDGELDLGTNSAEILISGNWLMGGSGSLIAGISTVTLDGNTDQTLQSDGQNFYNLVINNTGAGGSDDIVLPNDDLNILGTLTITDGDLDASALTPGGAAILVSGNMLIGAGGSFTSGTSELALVGSSDQTVTTNGQPLYRLRINNIGTPPDDDIVVTDGLDVNENLTITDGDLDVTGSTVNTTVAGNWSMGAGGVFTAGTGTVVFDGVSGTQTVASVQTFYNLVVDDANGGGDLTVQMTGTLLVDGDLSVDDGTLDLDGHELILGGAMNLNDTLDAGTGTDNNATLVIAGDWDTSSGTFTHTNSTVVLTGTTTGLTISMGVQVFNNLIINDGLAGYWALDEMASPSIDSSGSQISGNWLGNPVSTTSVSSTINFRNSRALDFDGTGDAINLGNMNMEDWQEITISAWFNTSSTADTQRIVSKDQVGTPGNFILWFESGSGEWRFNVQDDVLGGWQTAVYSSTVENDGAWHHIAGVVSQTDDMVYLYMDGVQVASDNFTASTLDDSDNEELVIGSDSDIAAVDHEFVGMIDDVRIYRRALDSGNIVRLAQGENPETSIGTYTLQDGLDINGDLSIVAGELSVGTNQMINISGDWENFGGVFTAQNGTVVFDGASGIQNILTSETFNNFVIDDPNGGSDLTVVTYGTLDINGQYLQVDSTLDLATANGGMWVEGDFTLQSGSFLPPIATIKFDGDKTFVDNIVTNVGTILIDPTTTLGTDMTCTSLTIDVGDTLITDGYEIDCSANMRVNGTLDAREGADGASTLNIGRNWRSQSGLLIMGRSTVIMDDDSGSNVFRTGDSNTFYNVTFDDANGGGDTTWELRDNINIWGTLQILDGTVDARDGVNEPIELRGNWNSTGGVFIPRQGTITLAGTGNQTITVDDDTFYNINIINSSGSTVYFVGSTTFNDFTSTVGSTELNFEAGSTFQIDGSLRLDGQGAGTRIVLDSSDFSTRFTFDVTNYRPVLDYLDVSNSEALTNDIVAMNSLDTSNTDSGEASPRWLFGSLQNVSGTTNLSDATTIAIAVNSQLQSVTASVSSGAWTIIDAVLNADDIVTVWGDGVVEVRETTGVTKYDGVGDITGMLLNSGTLAFGSDDISIDLTMTDLGQYDNNDDEDIVYLLSAGNTLQSVYSGMNLNILSTGTFSTNGYEMQIDGTLDINGTLDATGGAGGNTTVNVGGGWYASGGVFSGVNSTVIFSGTASTETYPILAGSSSFYNIKFDDNGGGTTWQMQGTMLVDGTFQLTDGIVDTNATNSYGLTSVGTFQITDGEFVANDSTVTLSNDFLVLAANAYNEGTSHLRLIGTGNVNCQTSGSTNPCVYDIDVAAAGQTTTMLSGIVVGNIMTIGSGVLDQSGFTNINLERDSGVPLIIDPAATISVGSIVYNDGTDSLASGDHQTLVVLRPSAETFQLTGNISASQFRISDNSGTGRATIDTTVNNYSITSAGNFVLGRAGDSSKYGTLVANSSTITIGGDFVTATSGTFNIVEGGSSNILVEGNWDASNGIIMRMGTSTVTFNGDSGTSQILFPATGTVGEFGNMVIDDGNGGSDLVVQMGGTLDMSGTLRITDGSFDLDGYEAYINGNIDIDDELDASAGSDGNTSIYAGGSWDATGGIFSSTDSTVVFTGTGSGLTLTSNAQAFNNLHINQGLIGYWKFDETGGTTVRDYSAYGRDGTYVGNPVPDIDAADTIKYNNPRSLEFDGVGDYININQPILSTTDPNQPYTISVWARTVTGDGLVTQYSSATPSDRFGIRINGGKFVYWKGGANIAASAADVDDGIWHHLTAVKSGSGANQVTLYIDGVADGTGTDADDFDAASVHFGIFGGINAPYTGNMDEVRIYDRALSGAEINRLANGYMPGTGVGTLTLQDDLDVNGTLSLNDGTLDTGANRQIYVARSWLNNGGIFVENAGRVELDGTSTDSHILTGSHTFNNLDITGAGTWTLQDNVGVNVLDISAGNLTYATSAIIEPVNIDGNSTLTGGMFTGNTLRFRQDGDLDIVSGTYTAPSTILEIDGDFDHDGGTFVNSSGTVMFTGTATNLIIDSGGGAVFQDVIQNDGMVAYFPFDESVSPSRDISGYQHTGQWMNDVAASANVSSVHHFRNDGSVLLDGDGDYIDLGTFDITKADGGPTNEMTISLWFNSNELANAEGGCSGLSDCRLLSKSTSTSAADHWWMLSTVLDGGTEKLRFRLKTDTAGTTTTLIATSGTVSEGVWHHAAAVYSGTFMRLYLDGTFVGSVGKNGNVSRDDSVPVWVGGTSGGSRFWDGYIDDLRIYDRAFLSAEVLRLAQGNQPSIAAGTYTLQSNLDVQGTLRMLSGNLDVSVSNHQVNLGADWENFGGVFNARTGTVVFDGADFQIPASETFYNFKKQMTAGPAQTLTFGQQSTVTINGTMQMQGFDGSNLLFLQSSSVGTQWNIDPQGIRDSDFLNVRDSQNLTAPIINPTNSVNGGNTVLWFRGPLKGAIIIVD